MILINNKEKSKLKESFEKIKVEITDHLEAINENTTEINANSNYMAQLEIMINKLSERLDEMELKFSKLTGEKVLSSEDFKDIVLNPKEIEIFVFLYERKGDLVDYNKIARHLGLTEELVRKQVSSLVVKGIPVVKKYFDSKVYLVLDPDFRNLQAKENVLKLR